jgi:hypothetical protein
VRAEAFVTEYFYNNAQRGFCETRIINQTLSLRFLGNTPMVFKPGMLFEGAVAVRYHDQVALPDEVLRDSQLEIKVGFKCRLCYDDQVALPDEVLRNSQLETKVGFKCRLCYHDLVALRD